MFDILEIAPAHEVPPGGVTLGQLAGRPTSAAVASPLPLQARSAPPQARQIAVTFFSSARARTFAALPSPGTGQAFECWPRSRASQHLESAFVVVPRYLDVALPIAR